MEDENEEAGAVVEDENDEAEMAKAVPVAVEPVAVVKESLTTAFN